jgi:hypothetical protein
MTLSACQAGKPAKVLYSIHAQYCLSQIVRTA